MRSVVCAAAAEPIISKAALISIRRSFRMVALPVLGMPALKFAPLGCSGHRTPGIDAAGWVKIPVLPQVRMVSRKQCRASDGKPSHADHQHRPPAQVVCLGRFPGHACSADANDTPAADRGGSADPRAGGGERGARWWMAPAPPRAVLAYRDGAVRRK